MNTAVILLAAGSGRRMGAGENKVLLTLGSRTILEHSLLAIEKSGVAAEVILAIRPEDEARIAPLLQGYPLPVKLVYGGEQRQDSVRNALEAVSAEIGIIAIHDAARCFVSPELIRRCVASAEQFGSGVAGRRVYDTVKEISGTYIVNTLNRDQLICIETPQCFRREVIADAYRRAYEDHYYGTDDAGLLERLGEQPVWVLSEEVNLKMTDPRDFEYGKFLVHEEKSPRTGMGYDAHRFAKDRRLILGGVEIPCEVGLLGHSDADVLVHAVMDALLGAAALGDIGKHFPDTDPQYQDISSIALLKHVGALMRAHGAEIVNLDATLILQAPKIAPYREQMRQNIADALQLAPEQVSVKATTTERMGFEGRGEGASAMAVCTIMM